MYPPPPTHTSTFPPPPTHTYTHTHTRDYMLPTTSSISYRLLHSYSLRSG